MIKNILFDLDDTLLDFKMAEKVALTKTLEWAGINPDQRAIDHYSKINSRQWERLEAGEITRAQVKLSRFEIFFREEGIGADPAQAAARYEHLLGQGHYWIPGAKELLKTLQGEYRLYLATNGTASVQHGRMESAGMKGYFQDIFISEELGADKPSLEYFRICFDRIPDFKPEETLMVGDRLTSDILGGNRAGIATVWYNPEKLPAPEQPKPTYTITSLDQLPGLAAEL